MDALMLIVGGFVAGAVFVVGAVLWSLTGDDEIKEAGGRKRARTGLADH